MLAAYLGKRRKKLRNLTFQNSIKIPVRGVTFQAEFDFEGPKPQFHATYCQKTVLQILAKTGLYMPALAVCTTRAAIQPLIMLE